MAKSKRRPAKKAAQAPQKQPSTGVRRPTREERWQAERQARRRRQMRNRVIVTVVVVALIGVLAARVVQGRRASERRVAAVTQGSCRFDRRSDSGRGHVPAPVFTVNPPSGGDHLAQVVGPRRYREAPEDGSVVHALEHGDIVIWHEPQLDGDATIGRVADAFPEDVLIVPRPDLPTPVVATAWQRRLLCDAVEETSLRRFVTQYRNSAPEAG